MTYKVNGFKYNSSSVTNMGIKEALVRRFVRADVTHMVKKLMDANVEGWAFDDFDNNYCNVCSKCRCDCLREATADDVGVIAASLNFEFKAEEIDTEDYYICDYCGTVVEKGNVKMVPAAPAHFYLVDTGFGLELRDRGEMILSSADGCIWARQSFGQLIMCDDVIDEIAKDWDILEGQSHSLDKFIRQFSF